MRGSESSPSIIAPISSRSVSAMRSWWYFRPRCSGMVRNSSTVLHWIATGRKKTLENIRVGAPENGKGITTPKTVLNHSWPCGCCSGNARTEEAKYGPAGGVFVHEAASVWRGVEYRPGRHAAIGDGGHRDQPGPSDHLRYGEIFTEVSQPDCAARLL